MMKGHVKNINILCLLRIAIRLVLITNTCQGLADMRLTRTVISDK